MLAAAYVDHRRPEIRALLDSRRRIADQTRRELQQRHEAVRWKIGNEARPFRCRFMMLPKMAQRLRHLRRACVRIRPEPDRRQAGAANSGERQLEMTPVVALGRDRVLNNRQERLRDVDFAADTVAVDVGVGQRRVDLRRELDVERSGVEDVSRILAHPHHAAVCGVVGHEMKMRELRDRVPHALVDAPADVAALDVRDRLVQVRSGHRNRELFEPVAADDHDVRIQRVNGVGEFERRQACGLRHRDVIAALDDVEQRRADRKAARFDVVGNVAAVFVQENRAAQHQLQLEAGIGLQSAQQQLTAAVVRAARDRKADPSFIAARNLAGSGRQQCRHR